VRAHDPAAMAQVKKLFAAEIAEKKLELFENPYDAAKGCDVLAVLTEWQEYRTPNFKKLKSLLKTALLIDGRDIYSSEMLNDFGFKYYGVGLTSQML
jgi:UDPglucose 6-dehydrogenase